VHLLKQGKRKSRSARGSPVPRFYLCPERQEEIAAVTLLGIALLTALGAFNLSRGNILDSWTDVLSILFGWGRLIAPFFFGGLGVWLLLDSLDLRPDIGWERPLGAGLLFLVLLTLLHITLTGARGLAAAQRGEGGGLIGFALSDAMVNAIGIPGTLLILIFAFIIGLILLLNLPLARILSVSLSAVHNLRGFFANSLGAWSNRSRSSRIATLTKTGSTLEPGRSSKTMIEPTRQEFRFPGEPPAQALAQRPAVDARIVGGQTQAPLAHLEWRLPSVQDILEESVEQEISAHEVRTKVRQIEETLTHFGVPAKVVEVNQGPTITQFGVEPGFLEQKAPDGAMRRTKVKVSRISALQHDLELALAAAPVRVEAPVPGKSIVGIEVPNSQISMVSLRGAMESEEFKKLSGKSKLAIALGQDVSGQPIVADLGSMPHLLIAGATGSGKSVCVNSLIACLLITNTPDDLRFVMVDPKRVELSAFGGIPHLMIPVVVEMNLAVAALQRAVAEMDRRFKLFAKAGARNIDSYRQIVQDKPDEEKLPYLVLVVDELADLMLVAPDEVEKAITRLAQMARATGIHLVLATQRPSVDVVTGLIKANFPSRISFAVTSQIDSRVVLDSPGAEKLLGRGDMLYMASDSSKLLRLQGCFVSDHELEGLVSYWKGFVEAAPAQGPLTSTLSRPGEELLRAQASPSSIVVPSKEDGGWVQSGLWNELEAASKGKSEEDELLEHAIEIVRISERASVSLLQRKLRIGYARAAKLMELLEQAGYVGPEQRQAGKGREVLAKGRAEQSAPVREFGNIDGPGGASSRPSDYQPPTASHGNGGGDPSFDDWTEEDWADLDKD
jgi:DNA segregation ATPase FtsK/SpoIIIE, S-DNA-T family